MILLNSLDGSVLRVSGKTHVFALTLRGAEDDACAVYDGGGGWYSSRCCGPLESLASGSRSIARDMELSGGVVLWVWLV